MEKTQKKRGAAKAVSLMAILILLAKFMGLLREVLIANLYGQGMESDMLNTATQIPLLFFDMVLGVAILSTFVPIYNKVMQKDGVALANRFADNFICVVTGLALSLAALGMLFAEPLVQLMTPGYAAIPGKVEQTAQLLRILFPSIAFTAVAYVIVGILQSHGEYTIPSLISVVSNGVMILYLMLFGNRLGLWGVAWSMLVAWALQVVVQLPALRKKGYRWHFAFSLKEEGLHGAARLAVPILVSSWIQPLCNAINMAFGSSLGDGAVSSLNWANKIYIIMVGVFAYAITNFIFPKLSRLSDEKDAGEFSLVARQSVGWIVFLIGPVCALFLALSAPIIQVVFQRGAFTAQNTALCATALFYYSFGMLAYGICEVLNKSFYAIEDGKTPMLSSVLGMVVNVAAALLLTKVFSLGVGGLALATALSSMAIAVCLLLCMEKRRPGFFSKAFWMDVLKILLASAAAFVAAKAVYPLTAPLAGGTVLTLLRLCLAGGAGLLVYGLLAFLLRVEEVMGIVRK